MDIERIENLTFEKSFYNDPLVAPEFFLKETKDHTYKIDSWIFGCLMYAILFGMYPVSFFSSLKQWASVQKGFDMKSVTFPRDLISDTFNYDPMVDLFSTCGNDKYQNIIKASRISSYSSIVPPLHLNETEKSSGINGMGIILDLIMSCLSVKPDDRPELSSLLDSDLFKFDKYEKLAISKFADNALRSFSGEEVIIRQIVVPLRDICASTIIREETVLRFENFLFFTLRKIDFIFFQGNEFKTEESSEVVSKNQEETKKGIEFVKVNDNDIIPSFNKKNSHLIKAVFQHKIIEILIFLVLRHFKLLVDEYILANKEELFKKKASERQKGKEEEKKAKFNFQVKEVEVKCGKLLKFLVEFLYKCVYSLALKGNPLCDYVEQIIEYIVKLFIGEDYNFLSERINNFKKAKYDSILKYLHYRTFFRDPSKLVLNFQEDDADKNWSLLNNNTNICDVKSYWSPYLCSIVDPLYREALTESGTGNYKYLVIKDYFTKRMIEASDQLNKEIQDDAIHQFATLTPLYVSEILILSECLLNIFQGNTLGSQKAQANKKNSITYIFSIFKNKSFEKIRACLDFKIFEFLKPFLASDDITLKSDSLNIFQEISLGAVDFGELYWLFGNNFSKDKLSKISKTEQSLQTEGNENYTNMENYSMVQFLNTTIKNNHTFILRFSDKFISNKRNISLVFLKEIARFFSLPAFLRPILRILLKPSEQLVLRQTCLEILFNIALSNDEVLIYNLNNTICNFYSVITEILDSSPYEESTTTIEFRNLIRNMIFILIEVQNPLIRNQIIKSYSMLKYMRDNNLSFQERINLEEIHHCFLQLRNQLNFTDSVDKINYLINSFKCCVQQNFQSEYSNDEEAIQKIHLVLEVLIYIFNSEFKEGLKSMGKNCMIFNIVKLFDWLFQRNHHQLLFMNKNGLNLIICATTKVKEVYKNLETEASLPSVPNSSNTIPQMQDGKGRRKSVTIMTQNPQHNAVQMLRIFHLIAIILQKLLVNLLKMNDDFYNGLFVRAKFGLMLGELFRTQYQFLSNVFEKKKNEINIFNNYVQEHKLRAEFIEAILWNKKIELKLQFLDTNFLDYLVSSMMGDFRKFHVGMYQKLSNEFLIFKDNFPIRIESIMFIHLMQKHAKENPSLYDELVKCIKKHHLVQQELMIIKNSIKGPKVNSVFQFINSAVSNNSVDLLSILEQENFVDYVNYAVTKDVNLRKSFPKITDFLEIRLK